MLGLHLNFYKIYHYMYCSILVNIISTLKLYRLDVLVNGLINAIGSSVSSHIFDYHDMYCCLSYKYDIIYLKSDQNMLSNYFMNWFQMWYNS